MKFTSLYPQDPSRPVITFTIFNFPKNKTWWALRQMGLKILEKSAGATFSKMLGSGRKGFDLMPNFRKYTFLASWENDRQANDFFASPAFQTYASRATEHYTIKMQPMQVHGHWDGKEPFSVSERIGKNYQGPVVVLTRAKIHVTKLLDFWRHVPQVHASLKKSPGVLLAMGIGENPITQQATVSIWDSVESLKKFAYQTTGHKEIVHRTRQRGWYSEELFARFVPTATQGTLDGKNILVPQLEMIRLASVYYP
ncbi:DUF3291 domain-containing protein [Arundinibacter roseus]|uniref:DUF3291 domain-containing protein n=1 Tax=Arundinibacter roseus TaxID=2070510 RepID=A0A4R4K0J6_9BACT|nr:DUF3291 domain-containing protein [Arundinibacter roseus]TDB59841.1 DUF3291 domain-containing protein [Arundinibacter roseus]